MLVNRDFETLVEEANQCRGCLVHLRTTHGRRRSVAGDAEDPLIVDPFVSDEAKILCSKAFRRMRQKTQVFTWSRNVLTRTRQTHVLEVVAVSVVLSDMLGLNTNLVRAAAFGHDIGHVPFGHQGEAWMQEVMGNNRFCHEVMGPIVAQLIERKDRGLGLTFETLEAMMCHSGNMAREGMTPEAWLLRYADKITYLFHDYNDIVVRARYPVSSELKKLVRMFGPNQRVRTTTAMCGLVLESAEAGRVTFEKSELGKVFQELRRLMYKVYVCVTQQNVAERMQKALDFLQMLNLGDPFLMLALMTDDDVELVTHSPMPNAETFASTSLAEIVEDLPTGIDLCDPCLDW